MAKTSNGLDVGDWISEQVSLIPLDSEFDTLIDRLLTANNWLVKIQEERRIAFSIVGFRGGRPLALIISNFLDFTGRYREQPTPILQIFRERPKTPAVRVAGNASAVPSAERAGLLQLLNQAAPPRQILEAIAKVNEIASDCNNGISRECVAGFLLASGAAEITPYGIPDDVEYVPRFVRRYFDQVGINATRPKLNEAGMPLPVRWVGMTAKVVTRRRGRAWDVAFLYAMRNVLDPVSNATSDGASTPRPNS